MISFAPCHHAEFHCLQPALLLLSFGPGPMAAVSSAFAQPPEVEIETTLGYKLFTPPALLVGLGHMLHTGVSATTTNVVGVLQAGSRFTLDFAIL